VQVFRTRWFTRFARKEHIGDESLLKAVREVENGLNDGVLGGGLVKKRLARAGEGKRGGYRTIIVYRLESRAVFVYGFPKNAKASLNAVELEAYQKLAQIYLGFTAADIDKALHAGELEEVAQNAQEVSD
jgi:hypothetical protein